MYQPSSPPSDPGQVGAWALRQLVEVARQLNNGVDLLIFQPRKVAPTYPEEGMVANADGTNWNPGGTGAGLYQYLGGAWVKL